jgi:trans-aconitate methyltransferase
MPIMEKMAAYMVASGGRRNLQLHVCTLTNIFPIRGVYLLPCDETEKDRLDVMHTLFLTARSDRLLNAPFEEKPPSGPTGNRSRVLDLGCGTGIWLLAMAERYKNTELLGIDLAGMGPESLLPNVELRFPCDYESPWSLGERSWDIIHLQMGLGSVANWSMLYHKVLNHLRPGVGWFEQVEIDLTPRCDDGTMTDGALKVWYENLVGATSAIGRSIAYDPQTRQKLKDTGFTDIKEERYLLPYNGWPADRKDHRVGLWYQIALSEGHENTGGYGMEAMSLAPLSRIYQWPVDHVRRLCSDALQQVSDTKVHGYNYLYVWTARAPYPNEPR